MTALSLETDSEFLIKSIKKSFVEEHSFKWVHSELKKQLESLNQAVLNMESKIQDLYIIKQAEMENAYIELTNGD